MKGKELEIKKYQDSRGRNLDEGREAGKVWTRKCVRKEKLVTAA